MKMMTQQAAQTPNTIVWMQDSKNNEYNDQLMMLRQRVNCTMPKGL